MTCTYVALLALAFCLGAHAADTAAECTGAAVTYVCPAHLDTETASDAIAVKACKTTTDCNDNCCKVPTWAATAKCDSSKMSNTGTLLSDAKAFACPTSFPDIGYEGALSATKATTKLKTSGLSGLECKDLQGCIDNCCEKVADDATGTCVLTADSATEKGSLIKADGTLATTKESYVCPTGSSVKSDVVKTANCRDKAECDLNCCAEDEDSTGKCTATKIGTDGKKGTSDSTFVCPTGKMTKTGDLTSTDCKKLSTCISACCVDAEDAAGTCILKAGEATQKGSKMRNTGSCGGISGSLMSEAAPHRSFLVMHLVVLGGAMMV